MVIVRRHTSSGRVFSQRCFYLSVARLALVAAAPFLGGTRQGKVLITGVQMLVLIAAVESIRRRRPAREASGGSEPR